MIHNITKIYIQLKINFYCIIIYYLSFELKKKNLKNIILYIIKPLYSLAEARNSYFLIYLDHYRKKLGMKILSYNKYLFITKNKSENFNIIKL